MSNRLRGIARDTVAAVERGVYANEAGVEVRIDPVSGTRLYLPDDPLPPAPPPSAGPPRIVVTNETSLDATRRLSGTSGGVACLVFASARNPGGGFLNGAQAQEESLARASALYSSLTAAPDFYAYHRADPDLRYSDRVIYSPRVTVFRDDKGRWLDKPYSATFLTAAAPNAGAIRRNQPDALATIPAVLEKRARRVLDIAAAHGERRLVLGAWGCGVFENDPEHVAAAFTTALEGRRHFDEIVFAVLDRQPGTPTYSAFAATFT